MGRVLLVEDELLVREVAAEDLGEAGFDVTPASDGDEALAILREGTDFDLLFTDIRMPGATDGWDLAREAQADDPRPSSDLRDRLRRRGRRPCRRRMLRPQALQPQGSAAGPEHARFEEGRAA